MRHPCNKNDRKIYVRIFVNLSRLRCLKCLTVVGLTLRQATSFFLTQTWAFTIKLFTAVNTDVW